MLGLVNRIWVRATEALDGLKTYLTSLALILLGLADYFDLVTLRPMFERLFGADNAALLAIFIPVVFAGLRYVTRDRPRGRRGPSDETKGNIDVPDGEA